MSVIFLNQELAYPMRVTAAGRSVLVNMWDILMTMLKHHTIGYLQRDVVQSVHPETFGGPYYAFYNTSKPLWVKDEYGSNVQGHVARSLNDNEYVSGGNMFIRRDILLQLGGFHANLGMKGKKKGYGRKPIFLSACVQQ